MLNFLVGRFHVGTPDSEVRAAIAAKLAPTCAPGERKAILAKAVRIHRANRRLYAAVIGRFHVGTPDAEVRAAIAKRLTPDLGVGERKAILAKAVRIHRANRRRYQRVMSRVGR